jgi:hypothetical protein
MNQTEAEEPTLTEGPGTDVLSCLGRLEQSIYQGWTTRGARPQSPIPSCLDSYGKGRAGRTRGRVGTQLTAGPPSLQESELGGF